VRAALALGADAVVDHYADDVVKKVKGSLTAEASTSSSSTWARRLWTGACGASRAAAG